MITNTGIGRLGQLGNQIFQYAALLGIGHRLGAPVKIPPLAQHGLGDVFGLTADIYTAADLRGLRHRFEESVNFFDPAWTTIGDGTDLHGYFQSSRYFADDEGVAAELQFLPHLESVADDTVAALRRVRPVVVAVTVRRGDYVINDEFVDLTRTGYYESALELLTRDLDGRGIGRDDIVFAVSSDDPAWCRSRFRDERFAFIDRSGDRALSDQEQLAALARCDHLIIANSTYSWWAAWLNHSADKVVVAADQWFTEGGDYPDRYRDQLPDGWRSVRLNDVAPG